MKDYINKGIYDYKTNKQVTCYKDDKTAKDNSYNDKADTYDLKVNWFILGCIFTYVMLVIIQPMLNTLFIKWFS